MKRNLLSVLILALLIVNIALTAVMMISVTSTNKKTADLVTNIATVMNLELTVPGQEGEEEVQVSLADTAIFNVEGSMTIPLAKDTVIVDGEEQKEESQGYIVFDISFSMNTKHEDYATYGETISGWDSLIKDAVSTVVSSHTMTECRDDFDSIKQEILEAVQDLFQSDFIYKVAINGVKYGY